MKNDILKISGVGFSKSSCLWSAPAAFDNFRRIFEYFNERMQKESSRGSGKDHFSYGSRYNLDVTKIMKIVYIQSLALSLDLGLGSLRDHQEAIPGL